MNSLFDDLRKENIAWQRTADAEFPYSTQREDSELVIRINEFPEEPMYTLIADGSELSDFDDWPVNWNRP